MQLNRHELLAALVQGDVNNPERIRAAGVIGIELEGDALCVECVLIRQPDLLAHRYRLLRDGDEQRDDSYIWCSGCGARLLPSLRDVPACEFDKMVDRGGDFERYFGPFQFPDVEPGEGSPRG